MSGLREYLAGENDGPGGISMPPTSRITAAGRPGGAFQPSRHPLSGRYLGRLPSGCEWDGSVYSTPQRAFRAVVDDQGEIVVVRRCFGCRRWLPRDDHFSPRARNGRGVTTVWEVRCYECKRANQRKLYAEAGRSERARQAARDRYARLMQDPERIAERRARNRAYAAKQRAKNPEKQREAQRRYQKRVAADPAKRAARNADARMNYRLRNGLELVRPGRQSRADKLPALPAAPLGAAIERLIQIEFAGSGPYLIAPAAKILSDSGRLVEGGQGGSQDGAPKPRETVCARLDIDPRALYAWTHGERQLVQFNTADRIVTRAGWCWWDIWQGCGRQPCSCELCVGADQARFAFEGERAA